MLGEVNKRLSLLFSFLVFPILVMGKLFVLVCVCVCICVCVFMWFCVCVCMGTWTYVHVYLESGTWCWVSLSIVPCFADMGSHIEPGTHQFSQSRYLGSPEIFVFLSFQYHNYRCAIVCVSIFILARVLCGSNSGPHIYKVNTLPIETFPLPMDKLTF